MRTKPEVCVRGGAEESEEVGGSDEKQSEGMTNAVKTTFTGIIWYSYHTMELYCVEYSNILLLPWHFHMLH